MCSTIWLLDESKIQTITELERTFGRSVDEFHDDPESLSEPTLPGDTPIRDCCLCHVYLEEYLTAVGATWKDNDWYGDIDVLMMPPITEPEPA